MTRTRKSINRETEAEPDFDEEWRSPRNAVDLLKLELMKDPYVGLNGKRNRRDADVDHPKSASQRAIDPGRPKFRYDRDTDSDHRTVRLPTEVWAHIIAAAERGCGDGSLGRRKDTRSKKIQEQAAIDVAKRKKRQLIKEGKKPGEAHELAAKEAQENLNKSFGISLHWSTIHRRMQGSSDK